MAEQHLTILSGHACCAQSTCERVPKIMNANQPMPVPLMSSVSTNANAINARGGPRQKTRYLPTTLRPASANPPVSGTRHARLGVLKPAELSCVVNESGLP